MLSTIAVAPMSLESVTARLDFLPCAIQRQVPNPGYFHLGNFLFRGRRDYLANAAHATSSRVGRECDIRRRRVQVECFVENPAIADSSLTTGMGEALGLVHLRLLLVYLVYGLSAGASPVPAEEKREVP